MNKNLKLCPFSKPILGKWCQCKHAKVAELCSGKMTCAREDDLYPSCLELDAEFKKNTRFILGLNSDVVELTHAQLMKIRCGALLGMQRVYHFNADELVNIREVIDKTISDYGNLTDFPYNEIVQDIKLFHHRK